MKGSNPYPNGILIVPTELVAPNSGEDDLGYQGSDDSRTLWEHLRIALTGFPAVVRLPAELIPKQPLGAAVLAGEACVRCGGLVGPVVPCGTGPEGAIFVHDPLCTPPAWVPTVQRIGPEGPTKEKQRDWQLAPVDELERIAAEVAIPVKELQAEDVTRYRVVFEVSLPNRIPREEHVALAIGVTAAADFLPDRVYRLDGSEWVQVYDEAGP